MNQEEHIYEVDIHWKEGRLGLMSSPVLEQSIEVATPPEFNGGIPGKWSPEHLFVASISSCLMSTFAAIAELSSLSFDALKIGATGTMARNADNKFEITEVILSPELVVADEKQSDKALRLLEKAKANCLISRSVTSRIILDPKVIVGTLIS